MEIIEAIRIRRSIRSYKPDPIPRKVLEEIIETCQWAGSPQNTQPWEFAIVGSELMKELKARIIEKLEANAPPESELPSLKLQEPYSQRAADYRQSSDSYQFPPGIENLDEKRLAYGALGEQFRGAPNAIIVYMDRVLDLHPLMLIGIGAMAQTVCLTALAQGVGTCVLGARWTSLLRERLDIPQSKVILHAIAIGYPETEARINNFPRTRLPLDSWVHWHGF